MPTSPLNSVIDHLRSAVLRDSAGLGDRELLGCFIECHDEAAFTALVNRHGAMVWGVCRRLLSHHDAEDAFQATFLVLVRKAASIVPREMVANWLYGVAHQTALQARRTAARRKSKEVQAPQMPDTEAVQRDQWPDVQPLLDQELSRLPDIYRAVIVLCDLEGLTRKEVARQLGVPEGTVAGRLARARTMLAKRLTKRGIALSGGALAEVLARNVASAGLPDSVVSSAISVARYFAAGQAAAAGAISVKVAALTEGVLKSMLMSKLKVVVAVVLVLGFMLTGATVFTSRPPAARGDKPAIASGKLPTAKPKGGTKLEPGVEENLKWGKPVNGLRAAIALRPASDKPKAGAPPDLFLVVQNVSKAPIRLSDTNVPPNVDLRWLSFKIDGQLKDQVGAREPALGDVMLQPRAVTFLPMFSLKLLDEMGLKQRRGHTIGSFLAECLIKNSRQTLVAHLKIEKAPAGAWTGKLVTGETSGAAAAGKKVKAKPPPAATEKK